MKNAKYPETISKETIRRITSVAHTMDVRDGLKFISTDLKIAPSCVELILTTLGYIVRLNNCICHTERLFEVLHYNALTSNYVFTAKGLELLYRLVFNSICKDESEKKDSTHDYPVIFDSNVQALTASDDKELIHIDVALNYIYNTIIGNYCITNLDKESFCNLLEITNKFKFDSNGRVSECIMKDINYYTYYIYNVKNTDKHGMINALDIDSTEIYINKVTYETLLYTISEFIKSRIEDGVIKTIEDEKSNIGDTLINFKTDKYISLDHFIAMIVENCNKRYSEKDALSLMERVGLIKIDKNNHISVNGSINMMYFYVNGENSIFVKFDKVLRLFLVLVAMDSKLFNAIQEIDPKKIDPYLIGIFNGYGYNMASQISPISPISPMSQNSRNKKK